MTTNDLAGTKAVVTGGSRGLGLGIVESLVAKGASVTVVARNPAHLEAVKKRLGVSVQAGDLTDRAFAHRVLSEVRPNLLVLNAGAISEQKPIEEHSWESFSSIWNTDVKGGLFWIQEALGIPLSPGSKVLLGSSGAALRGPPTSGGYPGAKRMLWMMASQANHSSARRNLGIQFQAIVPMQVIAETDFGKKVAESHAKAAGKSVDAYITSTFGKALAPSEYGRLVVESLTDARFEKAPAIGIKAETGVTVMEP